MRKLFTILSICMFSANYCFAAGMELSDLIETARETEVQQTMQEQTPTVNTEEAITPVKNKTTSPVMEETQAVEKVSPDTTTMETKTLEQPIPTTTLDKKPAQQVESEAKMKQINNETKTLEQPIPTTTLENKTTQPTESENQIQQINNETVAPTTNNKEKTIEQAIPTTKVENEMAQPDENILPEEKTMDSTTEMTESKDSTGTKSTAKTKKTKKIKN